MKVTKTKKTTISEIEEEAISETEFEDEIEEALAEADFEDFDSERYVCRKGVKYRTTLLEQAYEAWKKRKDEESLYGRDNSSEVNLTEELVYRCLQGVHPACRQILRR